MKLYKLTSVQCTDL